MRYGVSCKYCFTCVHSSINTQHSGGGVVANMLDYQIQGSQDRSSASAVFLIRFETEIPSPYDLVGR